jgi:hypothetical protein
MIKRRSSLASELNARFLDHVNVTKVKEFIDKCDDDENCAILVMEYVGQFSLQSLIEQKPNDLTTIFVKR